MTDSSVQISDLSGIADKANVKLVKLSGQLDETNVDERAREVYELIDAMEGPKFIVFDFENVEYVNSKFIGYFTDWYSKVSTSQGRMVIAAARDNIIDIFQVVGLTQLVETYATLEEAKLAL